MGREVRGNDWQEGRGLERKVTETIGMIGTAGLERRGGDWRDGAGLAGLEGRGPDRSGGKRSGRSGWEGIGLERIG
jgi:hypothetical protein